MSPKLSKIVQSADNLLALYGISPRKTVRALRATVPFLLEWRKFRKMAASARNADWNYGRLLPMLDDRAGQGEFVASQYFYHDLLVAKRIHRSNPRRHLDVGSSIAGFVGHVASFRDIEVADIRPISVAVPNIRFIQMDIMEPVRPELVAAFDSVSCLSVLEHFGLGRYGDRIDPRGYEIGFANLVRLVEPGGILPFGPDRPADGAVQCASDLRAAAFARYVCEASSHGALDFISR